MEMKYRGGIYRGRIQGGLPEGKVFFLARLGERMCGSLISHNGIIIIHILQGRLSLEDGSIYDGMWRYGKRSGLGTLYFNNGDVFQGSWRDDAMHGKVSALLLCS